MERAVPPAPVARPAWTAVDRDELRRFLLEDWGPTGRDPTSEPLLADVPGVADLSAREPIVVAGLEEAAALFELAGAGFAAEARDGDRVAPHAVLGRASGPLAAILKAERVALNVVGRMSGIATLTRDLQERVRRRNPHARIAATRKTTPGFRRYEKKAVVLGGGEPHRMTLDEAILVKDNHVAAAGSLEAAVAAVRAAHPGRAVEVEVSTAEDAAVAGRLRVEWVLLDNLGPPDAEALARLLRTANPRVRIECSGGLRPETVERYAPFADRLSLGWLTHSARAADVTLTVRPRAARKS